MRIPPRILIVDDEPMNLDILQTRLSVHGYEILTATNGEEALEVATAQQPDLILLDITMPGADGLVILRTLHEKYEKIRVVMMAAQADTPKANAALNCGASDYISKPVDLPTVKRTLQIHLGSA